MSRHSDLQIDPSWKAVLEDEIGQRYFDDIWTAIDLSVAAGRQVYPPQNQIFAALNLTPFDQVRVVILGQDPYHGAGQAMGLCFSVAKGVKNPRSLNRIFREMESDVDLTIPVHGDLSTWAKQGVFMPNAILTVEEGKPASHAKIGWHHFTDAVIRILSENKSGIIFLLWGGFAKGKRNLIDNTKHHILEAVHPSPLAGNAWFGNKHFSQVNQILQAKGEIPINWQV